MLFCRIFHSLVILVECSFIISSGKLNRTQVKLSTVHLATLCRHPLLSPRSLLHALRDILVVVSSRVSYLSQLVTFLASSYPAQSLISAAISSSVSFSAVAFALVPLLAVSSAAVPISYTFPPVDVAHVSISLPSDAIFRYLRGLLSMLFDVCSS